MKTAIDMLQEKGNKIFAVDPDTTIYEALHIMVENNIGAILVQNGDEIVGIWTERDLARNSLQAGFDTKVARIGDYMSTHLKKTTDDTTCYAMLDKFLGMRLRHLVVEKDGKFSGLLSIGDVIKAALVERTTELEKLNEMVKWDYYEDWRWKKKD
ncbi:MAG: CBS domain-containing protein [Deferribacteres bacterium]|nr:CBS domain-containing protein [candidate division KSB1 bacterium]MCB9503831.1 CBS domain-containing protein [Deferribacteres bacterium]